MKNLKEKLVSNRQSFFIQNKITIGLIGLFILLIIGGGFFLVSKLISSQPEGPAVEVDLQFNPEGPYALLVPRRDGDALFLNLKRTSTYDEISYELAYAADVDEPTNFQNEEEISLDQIDRGVTGTIETKNKQSEYSQEVLFGTCSKNVCKYDKGVENGTLTLHIKDSKNSYRMNTLWHLQRPDVALGVLTAGDAHFTYRMIPAGQEMSDEVRSLLTVVGYSIINELTGAPKFPSGRTNLGKVYALNVPDAKSLLKGEVTIELAENAPQDAKIARYNEGKNDWEQLETKIEGGKLTANAEGAGIFTVLANSK